MFCLWYNLSIKSAETCAECKTESGRYVIRFPYFTNISFYPQVKKHFFVGNSGFFVDNFVQNMWITPAALVFSGIQGGGDRIYLSRSSPIFTTSPAPIVMSRSPGRQFSFKNDSICSKLGK